MNKICDFIEYINKNNLGHIDTSLSFKDITTIKIGGKIACLYLPKTLDDLVISFRYILKEKIPYYIVGRGSNILASDKDFNIVVINLKNLCKIIQIDNNKFIVEAGINNSNFAYQMAKQGYTKQEFLSVIPGSIGGAIYMNAGAYGTSMKDIIKEVTYLTVTGNLITINQDTIDFSYRNSVFQQNKGIIVSSVIELNQALNKNLPLEKIHTFKSRKKETQPLSVASAGSTFKNGDSFEAWKVIDKLGYRGYIKNNVMVSKKHTNYLINIKDATYDNMMELVNQIKQDAKDKLNIELKCEWEILE